MTAAKALILKINATIINPLIVLLFSVAVVVFIWGIVQFIWGTGGEEDRMAGKRHMVWGIVGIFIMVGVFGILAILMNTLGIKIPKFP